MLIERKEKKRKEKKSKGLFYLIFTLTIIAALTISCKNKPTGTNDFSGFEYVNINFDSEEGFAQFVGKTIRSKAAITVDGSTGYFWATFDDKGISFGQGTEAYKPTGGEHSGYPHFGQLNKSALSKNGNKANFNDTKVKGDILFEANVGEDVNKIIVNITDGASAEYLNKNFDCGFVK